jgi:hypothetical protein
MKKSIVFAILTMGLSLSTYALDIGEFSGVGQFKGHYYKSDANNDSCKIAINANYNDQEKVLTYDYADLCMSELSYPLNGPNNDYQLKLKVDENGNLFEIKKDGSLSGPIGTKIGNEFSFTLKKTKTVKVIWTPASFRDYMRNYSDTSVNQSCGLMDTERVKMVKEISYRLVLNGDTVSYNRSSNTDMLPFFMSKSCYQKHSAELQKYRVTTLLNAELTKLSK